MLDERNIKIGSKVMVSRDLRDSRTEFKCPKSGYYFGVVGEMKILRGDTVTIASITKVHDNCTKIRIKEDGGKFSWTLSMFDEIEVCYNILDFDDISKNRIEKRFFKSKFKEELGENYEIKKIIVNGDATIVFYTYKNGRVKKVKTIFDGIGNKEFLFGFRVCLLKIAERNAREVLKGIRK